MRNFEYNNLDAEIWPSCKENTSKNIYIEITLTSGNSDTGLSLKSKPSNWACTGLVSIWSCLLPELSANQVVLPTLVWENASPMLWDSFPAFGTEDVFPSQQIELSSETSALGLRSPLEKLRPLCKCTCWIWKTYPSLTVPTPHCLCFDLWLSGNYCCSLEIELPRKWNFSSVQVSSPSAHRPLIILCWVSNDQD